MKNLWIFFGQEIFIFGPTTRWRHQTVEKEREIKGGKENITFSVAPWLRRTPFQENQPNHNHSSTADKHHPSKSGMRIRFSDPDRSWSVKDIQNTIL